MRRIIGSILAAALWVPALASAEERVVLFRSVEDPSTPPDPAVCARAPFFVNVRLGASLWSVSTRSANGEVNNPDVHKVGTATACLLITDPTFPEGLQQNFYVEFNLPEGTVVAGGTCKLVSNNVPEAAVVLAGCNLKVISGPPGTIGGAATSNSVFNPARKAGYNTGSYWTLLLYDVAPSVNANQSHADHHHDLEWVDDYRSDAELQSAQTAAGM